MKVLSLFDGMSCGQIALRELGIVPDVYYASEGKSPALAAAHGGQSPNVLSGVRIRQLTPTECARLQTVPDWYRWGCSATQQYRMLGNGWTVEVIRHILSYEKMELTALFRAKNEIKNGK